MRAEPVAAAPAGAAAVAAGVARALAALDPEALARQYREQGEFLFLRDVFSPETVAPLVADAERLEPGLNRNWIPRHKKGGSVSHFAIAAGGPALLALYRSEPWRRFLARVVGADLRLCPEADPHACALYFYTRAGDHMGYHYDTSYYRGARYTVLVGLVQNSSSRLLCRLHTRQPGRAPQELAVATTPGSLVIFNGDQVYHGVSPSGPGERRIVLTLEYVTSTEMGRAQRAFSDLKDAFAYFGLRALWQGRRRARGTTGPAAA